jgi:dimethylargininase
VARASIDYRRAVAQHRQYCQMLAECGADVRTLEANLPLPDCAFVEDTAVILDEVAVLASMGAESRRAEPAGIEPELRRYRQLCRIPPPATLEGGDVLTVGRTLLVGLSSRTNRDGITALAAIVEPYGYRVTPVPVGKCLHLKTACGALPGRTLLVNPNWLPTSALPGLPWIRVPQEEPWGANVATVNGCLCVAAHHVRTAEMLAKRGVNVRTVDLSEFAKAEGGVTCLSLLLNSPPASTEPDR